MQVFQYWVVKIWHHDRDTCFLNMVFSTLGEALKFSSSEMLEPHVDRIEVLGQKTDRGVIMTRMEHGQWGVLL